MRIPGYPSNREADKGTKVTVKGWEGVPEEEAKSGGLFTHRSSWGGVMLYGMRHGFLPPFRMEWAAFSCAVDLNLLLKKEKLS